MAKKSISLFNTFKNKITILDKIRKKQENLYDKNLVVRRDIEEVYSALYIDSLVFLEALIEDLFIGILSGQIISRYSNVKPKIQIKNSKLAREIVYGSGNYFDWFPYNKTEKIAKIYLRNGNPFTSLDKNEKNDLEKCFIIRNAIAHKSYYSINKFNKDILAGLILNPRDKKPNAFLRKQFSQNPNTNYYQQYIIKILKIAQKLC